MNFPPEMLHDSTLTDDLLPSAFEWQNDWNLFDINSTPFTAEQGSSIGRSCNEEIGVFGADLDSLMPEPHPNASSIIAFESCATLRSNSNSQPVVHEETFKPPAPIRDQYCKTFLA